MADEKSYLEQFDKGSIQTSEQALEEAEKALREINLAVKWEEKNWEIQENLFVIMQKGLEMLTPERKFQEDPKFWELHKELQALEHEKQGFQHEKKMENLMKAKKERQRVVDEMKGE